MTQETTLKWTPGNPAVMGATKTSGGVNFAFAAPEKAKVSLVLRHPVTLKKMAEIPMNPVRDFGNVRSVCVNGLKIGRFAYSYLVDGERKTDPYAEMIRGGQCFVCGQSYDWEDDRAPHIPVEDLMIYKLHVRGFTKKANKTIRHKGTFRGLAEAAGYIRDLGMNAVLLMPAYEWDPALRMQPYLPIAGEEWRKYRNSGEEPHPGGDADRDADKSISDAENVTDTDNASDAENVADSDNASDAENVTDTDNASDAKNVADTDNASDTEKTPGTESASQPKAAGNTETVSAKLTLKAKPLTNYWGYSAVNYYYAPNETYASAKDSVKEFRDMVKALHREGIEVLMEFYVPRDTDPSYVMGAVRKWKTGMHVDGFHFIGEGVPMLSLVKDPLLKTTKMLFERIDGGWATGGEVPDERSLIECNADFEHTARRFLKSDEGQTGPFAAFIRRNPATHAEARYMADADGFTLYDAVSYDWKHNEENGENNNDGSSENYSWNCGAEGPSRKKNVRTLRLRQVRNALVYVFLAQGVPVLYAGDEGLNTQNGNNNAYASDNPTGWTDWKHTKDAESIRTFARKLIHFRAEHPIFHMKHELRGSDYRNFGCPDISFHDEKAWVCSFENANRTLAVLYNGRYTLEEEKAEDGFFLVLYNAHWDEHLFALPDLPKGLVWSAVMNTGAEAGAEFSEEKKPCGNQKYFEAGPRSCAVLTGIRDPAAETDGAKKKVRKRRRSAAKPNAAPKREGSEETPEPEHKSTEEN